MLKIRTFVFSPFYENTYVLYDETGECVIVDPGCYDVGEQSELKEFIESNQLKPVKLLNTHCHLDHIFGNAFVKNTWDVPVYMHKDDMMILQGGKLSADMYGVQLDPPPQPDVFLEEGETVGFGNTTFEILFVPGHAPGHIAFFHRESKNLFSGDVLFQGSIGRVDLPGGSMEVLMKSIITKVLPLGDEVKVHSGHGPVTDVGTERRTNPFVLQYQ